MGVYRYTVRAKTTKFNIGGISTPVHHFCYAYKYHSYNSKGDELAIRNYERHAEQAFANLKSPYIVLCDEKTGVHNGDLVYRNLITPVWDDCFELKAEPFAFAKKNGRTFGLSNESEWYFNTSSLDATSGLWLDEARQNWLCNGKLETRRAWSDNKRNVLVDYHEAVTNARQKIKAKEIADDYAKMLAEAARAAAFTGLGEGI